ncbi:MAG: class II fructose-bisphosphate aldolase family protein [Candidatus Doudnabacteria bacterium]|nr:class II fructose-bisphosphate aldolase family protein [Candidatus Doudnabacteria bacterium]
MLVHIKDLVIPDMVGKFAYPAFNTQNLETTMGIIQAADGLNTPVIIEVSEGAVKYAGLTTIYEIMATLADSVKVPVALHMDHGKDMEQLRRGIELGFSSVMIDHSGLSTEENIRDTKAMVEFAHSHGAWVQGEIGKIRGSEDWVNVSDSEALLTDPDEAEQFYRATGVDTLAGSFGTVHGIIKIRGGVTPHVDVARINAIHQRIKVPLVLHGASGVDENVIHAAIEAGIAIINIDTELRLAYGESLRKSLADQPEEVDPRYIMKPVIEAVKKAAERKLLQFGTKNLIKQ